MNVSERGVQLKGSGQGRLRCRVSVPGGKDTVVSTNEPHICNARIRQCIIRVLFRRKLEVLQGDVEMLARQFVPFKAAFQIEVVSFDIATRILTARERAELDTDLFRDGLRDLALHAKEIADGTLVRLRPKVGLFGGVNQLD